MKKIRLKRDGYPYTSTRISARKGRLFPRGEYQRLLKLELNGIIRALRESSYRESIDELVSLHQGVDLIERALVRDMVKTAQGLRRISAPEVRLLIDAFLARYDLENVKAILRGTAAKSQTEYLASLLVPAGALDEEALLKLIDVADVGAILGQCGLPGAKEARAAFEKGGLAEAENVLDTAYFAQNLALARRVNAQGAAFTTFLKDEIDIVNIKTLLRLKRLGTEPARIGRHVIDGGNLLGEQQLMKLAHAANVGALIVALKKTSFKDAFAGPGEDLVEIELALEKRLIKRSFLFTRQNPLSVMSILSYLLAKVTEMRNLRTIVKAKQLGIEDEFIEQKLVVV